MESEGFLLLPRAGTGLSTMREREEGGAVRAVRAVKAEEEGAGEAVEVTGIQTLCRRARLLVKSATTPRTAAPPRQTRVTETPFPI